MKVPLIPPDEAQRLAILQTYEVLDTEPEAEYDDLVKIAGHVLRVPIAAVSLVDENRQWFKAKIGLSVTETSREISFCGHAVASGEVLVVPDARADDRFSDNPLVTGDPNIRFYAGVPLVATKGHTLGTLCVISPTPRQVDPAELEILRALGRQVTARLQQRRQVRELARLTLTHAAEASTRRRFFELSKDLLCTVSHDGRFLDLNSAWETELGFARGEMVGRAFVEFVHPDDTAATIAEAARLQQGGVATISFENRWRTKAGGSRWFLWSAAADAERGTLIAVGRDVSAIKATHEALREAKAAAELLSTTKSAFLANMSHELRTPLNSVIGFTALLSKNKSGNLDHRELDYLRRIGDNGKHLLALINDVLDLSKVEAGKTEIVVEKIDVGDLLDIVLGQLQGEAAVHGTTLRTAPLPAAESLVSDAGLIRQILINLVGNALKFTRGGEVEVRLVVDTNGEPLRIEVADNGPGIQADQLELIFETFRQAASNDPGMRGTGLGLSICRSLAGRLGFTVHAASVFGEGSVFALGFTQCRADLAFSPPRPGRAD